MVQGISAVGRPAGSTRQLTLADLFSPDLQDL